VVFGGPGVGAGGSLDLSALNGTNGFVINGIDAGDSSGNSVSTAGDVNGDGIDDIIIGAKFSDPNGQDKAGESYVVFGGAAVGAGGTLELSSLNGVNGFVINGFDEFDQSGISVSCAGDINGDGTDDIIIGAIGGNAGAGTSYVVFGGAAVGAGGTLELVSLNGIYGFAINGINTAVASGVSVSWAGDVNDDGTDDIIIGAYRGRPNGVTHAGESYVVFGAPGLGAGLWWWDLSELNGVNGFFINGIDSSDHSGFSVSSAGDINGDGVDDIIIGAYGADPNGQGEAGESYVVFGWKHEPAAPACEGDANGDGVVDVNDISYVLFRLGNACP
jgi:hypothetical protein